jgi:NAD(P)-dependent dehydrogenase (short-subunit alcohol dehydrogenase family)
MDGLSSNPLATMLRLDGRRAVVTGAGAGLGRAIAIALAQQGAEVALLDRDAAAADESARQVREAGGRAQVFVCDVAHAQQVQDAVGQAASAAGLDIVVNSAGVASAPGMPFTNNTEADWDRALAINLKGAVHACQAAHPWLLRSPAGRIVNISSITGVIAAAYMPPYSVSKAALKAWTRVLARELAPHHIAVNAVCPGFIWTPLWEKLGDEMARHDPAQQGSDAADVFAQRVRQHVPMQRPQTVQDVAYLVTFLCSAAAANITGQIIGVDGGVTI